MRRRVFATGMGLILTVTLAACGQGNVRRSIAAASVAGTPGYAPARVTVDKGDKVFLTVNNLTDKTHGFSVEGYGIRKTVDPSKPMRVIFRADKPGTYKIFCQLHPAHGQATLVVQ